MKISKNKKIRFFLMSQGSLNPKIRFLVQKVCPVARSQATEGTRSVFYYFFPTAPGNECPNIFWARIGPLPLGFVSRTFNSQFDDRFIM